VEVKPGPWPLLRNISIDEIETPRRVIEIVKDFLKIGTDIA